MAQQLRVYTAFAEDPSSDPTIHIGLLTTAYNSSSTGFDVLLKDLHTCGVYTYTQPHTHNTHIK